MLISIFTGITAGALHVVAGADHLVAIAPVALSRPRRAFRDGLAWGVGHSAGVLFFSCIAILFKDLVHIQRMSSLAELTVGIALLVVGAFAIRTSFGLNIHTHSHQHEGGLAHKHVHLHVRGRKKHNPHHHAATSIGLLQGLAGGSHLLAVIPALALPPIGAITYMFSYLLGSVVAMGAVVLAMSLAALKIGQKALPLIIGLTGGISVLTGFFWIHKISISTI